MAKRKKSNVGMILSGLSVLLGLAAIIMLFLPAVAIKDTDTTYTGLQITFGYTTEGLLSIEVFKFSFMNLLTYILAAAGVVFAILSAMGRSGKFASFIAAAAFIVSGVFFILAPSFLIANDAASTVIGWIGGDLGEAFELAVGGIIGAVCAFLAGLLSLFKSFAK